MSLRIYTKPQTDTILGELRVIEQNMRYWKGAQQENIQKAVEVIRKTVLDGEEIKVTVERG